MPPLSIMIKPASSLCNMRCRYCFYHDVAQSREEFSFGVMKEETMRRLIQQALLFADGESVAFAFQGGEPLMAGIGYFKSFVRTVNELNKKGSKVFFGMQTNGLLLNDEWAEFLHENSFLVGLSLDGDVENNRFRIDAERKSTQGRVLEKARLLEYHEVDFNILTVLTGDCAENVEQIYRYFRRQGFRYLQFIPCLRPFGSDEKSELYMTNEQYASFLIRLFNLYVKDYVRGNYTSIRQFDNWVHIFNGGRAEQCGMMGHCTHQFVVEGNGNVYPCDFYCIDKWLLGNVETHTLEQMAKSKTAEDFIRESLHVPEKCKACRYYPMCRAGGCKRSREDTDYCEAYKKFFAACLPLFRVFSAEKN